MVDFVLPWAVGDDGYCIYCSMINFINFLEGYKQSSEAISKTMGFFFNLYVTFFKTSSFQ